MSSKKSIRILIHIIGWLLFFSIPALLSPNFNKATDLLELVLSPLSLAMGPFLILFFYLNTEWLIPKYFLNKKYSRYFLLSILIVVIFIFISDQLFLNFFKPLLKPFNQNHFPEHHQFREGIPPGKFMFGPRPQKIFPVPYFLFLLVWAFSMVIKLTSQWNRSEKELLKAQADKVEAELQMLRTQINPHFLFNTLNNIYTLAITNNEKTADTILQLSKLMRYISEEHKADFISLEEEIDFLQDYIALQKIRINESAKVDFIVEGNIQGCKIAPMILLPFVENAFKYGISTNEESPILINLAVKQNKIVFIVENKIFHNSIKKEGAGIGIKNTLRRLLYIYGTSVTHTITSGEESFYVELEIPK